MPHPQPRLPGLSSSRSIHPVVLEMGLIRRLVWITICPNYASPGSRQLAQALEEATTVIRALQEPKVVTCEQKSVEARLVEIEDRPAEHPREPTPPAHLGRPRRYVQGQDSMA